MTIKELKSLQPQNQKLIPILIRPHKNNQYINRLSKHQIKLLAFFLVTILIKTKRKLTNRMSKQMKGHWNNHHLQIRNNLLKFKSKIHKNKFWIKYRIHVRNKIQRNKSPNKEVLNSWNPNKKNKKTLLD